MINKSVQNKNYCATVVEISKLTELDNCDNLVMADIYGNSVLVSTSVKVGDVGLYFPPETQLSTSYAASNNLFKDSAKNTDKSTGYLQDNRRVRCIKIRGHYSDGLFMPLTSVSFACDVKELSMGDEFDSLGGISICNKYAIAKKNTKEAKPKKHRKHVTNDKLLKGQFRFHEDTLMLYKYIDTIKPDDHIHISYKLHGTSCISSNILCKKKLRWYEKVLKKIWVNVVDTEYDHIYSSRRVIKNACVDFDKNSYYGEDIWKMAHEFMKAKLPKGMTAYYEIVGYLPSGKFIQDGYDYGCKPYSFDIYVYRLTQTNVDGVVYEFPAKHVKYWCDNNGVNPVPELYHGSVKEFFRKETGRELSPEQEPSWRSVLLESIKSRYNEKDCYMCSGKLPEEGCVIRVDSDELVAFKCKSKRFHERETKMLDKGNDDIES